MGGLVESRGLWGGLVRSREIWGALESSGEPTFCGNSIKIQRDSEGFPEVFYKDFYKDSR